jgi:hypothetical protein
MKTVACVLDCTLTHGKYFGVDVSVYRRGISAPFSPKVAEAPSGEGATKNDRHPRVPGESVRTGESSLAEGDVLSLAQNYKTLAFFASAERQDEWRHGEVAREKCKGLEKEMDAVAVYPRQWPYDKGEQASA